MLPSENLHTARQMKMIHPKAGVGPHLTLRRLSLGPDPGLPPPPGDQLGMVQVVGYLLQGVRARLPASISGTFLYYNRPKLDPTALFPLPF